MRGLQGTFPRWKKRLPGDHEQRRLVIEAIVLMHNYRTEMVGLIKLKLSSTRSMFGSKIFMGTTGLRNTIFVLAIAIATRTMMTMMMQLVKAEMTIK
jgi:hypothetical protein